MRSRGPRSSRKDAPDTIAVGGRLTSRFPGRAAPFAPLRTSGGFDRGAGRLDISFRTLRGASDLLRKLRSSSRIGCDDRLHVSRVKKAVDDWINQTARTAQTVEVNVPEVPKLGNALAGRPKWVAGRPHRETRGGAWWTYRKLAFSSPGGNGCAWPAANAAPRPAPTPKIRRRRRSARRTRAGPGRCRA